MIECEIECMNVAGNFECENFQKSMHFEEYILKTASSSMPMYEVP